MAEVTAKVQVRKVTVGAQLGAIEVRDGRGDLRWLMLRPQVVESTVYVASGGVMGTVRHTARVRCGIGCCAGVAHCELPGLVVRRLDKLVEAG